MAQRLRAARAAAPARARLLDRIREDLFARPAERRHDQIRPCHRALLGYLDDAGARLTELARALALPDEIG